MRKYFPAKIAWSLFAVTVAVLSVSVVHAQSAGIDTAKTQKTGNTTTEKTITYPKSVGYLSFIIPLATANKDAITPNFRDGTSIGFPVGVNVLYSNRFGFSYEFTPTIKWAGGTSKVSNLLFDPGTMFRFDHGFTIITRLAFETSGRYGVTPVFNQVYAHTKDVNYFVALSLPARFGNSQLPTLGLNLQLGFTFN
ncbi:MAG TPA: hypothetical protein VHS53_16675 [Mucilaginibacter sp.]|jgi:hypothetical protein|nr:hypothetical protein [Mucilaginibacter sp.]HWD87329.1 hypothetical protein [Mucilaginibacter sp.]